MASTPVVPQAKPVAWWKRLLVFGAGAGAGVGLVFLGAVVWRSQHAEPTRFKAPEKFIPAQTLLLLAANGRNEIGYIMVSPEGRVMISLNGQEREPVARFSTLGGPPLLTVFGASNGSLSELSILMRPQPMFHFDFPSGKRHSEFSKGWHKPEGAIRDGYFIARRIITLGWRRLFPEKPNDTSEELIPTQDHRLVDRDGRPFAVLGLSPAGQPAIGLFDRDGAFLAFWVFGGVDLWSGIYLLDESGKQGVFCEWDSAGVPHVTISEPTDPLNTYVLDPDTGEEKPGEVLGGAIPWLQHRLPTAAYPVVLVDQRRQVIWRAP
jgi:hypothetical protein